LQPLFNARYGAPQKFAPSRQKMCTLIRT